MQLLEASTGSFFRTRIKENFCFRRWKNHCAHITAICN
ncbi:Uncharacterised protein [Vibrio cholerae]|nr:Uncharacterised protein [Vibrio cholerae]